MPQNNRYSNIAVGTRQLIIRQDSIEMHLDRISESPALSRSRSMGNPGHNPLRAPQKRSSAGHLLDAIRGRKIVQDMPRSSIYVAASNDVELRQVQSTASKTLSIHQAMSRGGRPMSMHQAMTVKSIYDESMLPTCLRARNTSLTPRNSRPASTAAFTALSDVQRTERRGHDSTTESRLCPIYSAKCVAKPVCTQTYIAHPWICTGPCSCRRPAFLLLRLLSTIWGLFHQEPPSTESTDLFHGHSRHRHC
jgi:hypothetical protein